MTKVSFYELFVLDYFTVFQGSKRIQVVLRGSLHCGTPENRLYDDFFSFFQERAVAA